MGIHELLAGQPRPGTSSLIGTSAELRLLFGEPLPCLPPGEKMPRGGERIFVEMIPRLRESFSRWLAVMTGGMGEHPRSKGHAGGAVEDAELEYLTPLAETCRAVLLADRRQGLYNLFWVAHSREIADAVERHFAGVGREPHLRYQMHPILSGLLHRADEMARTGLSRPERRLVDFRLSGEFWNDALVRSIMDDQFPLTEPHPAAFDPDRALIPENRRFRISAAAFQEINRVLRERLEHGIAQGEQPLRRLVRECCPGTDLDPSGNPRSWDHILYADVVRDYLLRDCEGVAAELARSRILRRERPSETGWSEFLTRYADVTCCLRRAEAVAGLRQALEFTGRGLDQDEIRHQYLEGRLFRFSMPEGIQSNLRTTTILFADLRGFTVASEGLVSERDLTRELYEIFDPASMVVRRFGGVVDKFLGDGIMATFIGSLRGGDEALAAVRAAVIIQQVLGQMRLKGSTEFRMGISLHVGRVMVARFLPDEQHVDTTIIGRQVNIASRLSAPGGGPGALDDDPGVASPPREAEAVPTRCVGEVSLDSAHALVNRGIAVSGALLETLKNLIPLEQFREADLQGYRWYDPDLRLWLHFGYVGEARFKGIDGTVPVYSLVAAAPAGSGSR